MMPARAEHTALWVKVVQSQMIHRGANAFDAWTTADRVVAAHEALELLLGRDGYVQLLTEQQVRGPLPLSAHLDGTSATRWAR